MSVVLVLAIMWGVVVAIDTTLFFPEIVKGIRREIQAQKAAHHGIGPGHWHLHAPWHA